jgi:uncharacterized membrane protein
MEVSMAPQQAERLKSKQKTNRQDNKKAIEEGEASTRRPLSERTQSHPEHNSEPADGRLTQEEMWAYGLGLFGIGLGLAELMAPRRLARMIGAPPRHDGLVRAMGFREIASGIGILTQRAPAMAVWSRVAGDAMDLACLSAAFMSNRSNRGRVALATAAVAGATLLDVITAQQLSRGVQTRNGAIPFTVTLTINRKPDELYRYWRDFANLPKFMKHLDRVESDGERWSHWVAKGPAGSTIEWDGEITDDRPNELIAWRSVKGSKVDHAGSIRFEPATGDRGTIVTVNVQYRPPLGTVGDVIAAWSGEDPNHTVKMDLRRFKQMMETGEIITTQGQPARRAESTSWKYDSAVRR